MENFSLKQLILFAYGVPNNQTSGVQTWMDSSHFDIQATADRNASVKQVEGPMLQALLEDRFHLKVHRETMERPVHELTVEKGGGKMQLSNEGSCVPYSMDSPPPLATYACSREGLISALEIGLLLPLSMVRRSWPGEPNVARRDFRQMLALVSG